MTSKGVAQLLADLGVGRPFSAARQVFAVAALQDD